MAAEHYDAFVSYGHGDAAWVHALAENLERLGLHVFLDAWELVPGDLIAVQLQRGLAAADAVVFVVSAASVGRGWVNEEFAATIASVAAGGQRLIPVLAGEVALPPMVAARLYVDFRDGDDPAVYEAKVRELAAAIRGRPGRDRPAPGGAVVPLPRALPALRPQAAGFVSEALPVTPPVGGLPVDVRGRDGLLAELQQALLRRKSRGSVWVLTGMGGLGKSTVALAIAEIALVRGRVWWVTA